MSSIKGILVSWIFFLAIAVASAAPKDGDYYYALGGTQEAANDYSKALRAYAKAAKLYVKEAEPEKLILAKSGWYRAKSVLEEFVLSLARFKSKIRQKYPWASKDDIAGWIAGMPLISMDINGAKTRYYSGELDNLRYRNQDIMDAFIEYHGNPLSAFMDFMLDEYVKADYGDFSLPCDRPMDMLADLQLVIKKSKIPKNGDGMVRVWWPMPINTPCQGSIIILSVEPAEYVVQAADPDGDIGVCYFEIPIAEITKDLVIRTQVRFKHYQQRFVIDPGLIGAYDTGSDLYLEYTASTLNTAVTPEIQARAELIVGAETNPYLAAKLLNDYIVANVDYSFPEYDTVDSHGTALSSYTEEHQFGDCGYQSVYFSALCRSIGIPARAAGGFQYFSGKPGTHFWAEFYLPAPYNQWIPVDVTAAGLAKEVSGYSADDLKDYRDYFFGQQDPMRMVVQNDVDLPLSPEPEDGSYYFKACLQEPVVLFYGSDKVIPMVSRDRKFFSCGTSAFNYDQAIAATAGGEILLDAADFGLALFDARTKFEVKDNDLGKIRTVPLAVKEFNAEMTGVTVILPESLQRLAYRLAATPPREQAITSARWVIVGE
jgi:transglutaminase-like putative cysteine protease